MEDKSCKTRRWQILKAQLNNLPPKVFREKIRFADDPIILDVRTDIEFANGNIANAINVDYLADGFWDQIEQISTSKSIFVYCRSGRRSIRVCTLLKNGGFDKAKIFNLDGGYQLWEEEIK
jgi:rhodanese-related sulfurtransferase